jgi:hypothetical protein
VVERLQFLDAWPGGGFCRINQESERLRPAFRYFRPCDWLGTRFVIPGVRRDSALAFA